MDPKIIAMYLPQFHRVKENDEWWGEGYTDWVAAKNAKPLFEGHNQPRIPLNDNYYDLMDKKTMEWQASIMKKYGIDGVCMYHYYFQDGFKILERPAENLLKWKDIDMPFCFCWANQTWARSWSNNLNANSWIKEKNGEENVNKSPILALQKYGNINDWRMHFRYLTPFFKDHRYIKKNGKPIFIIYNTNDIAVLKEMLDEWRCLARHSGIEGLYVIGLTDEKQKIEYVDYSLISEPSRCFKKLEYIIEENIPEAKLFNYKDCCDFILEVMPEEKMGHQVFVGYDHTPRSGESANIVINNSPILFQELLSKQLAKTVISGNEYLFINAWNEWGEGMYMEPDSINGYRYLEAVKNAQTEYKKYLLEYSVYNKKKENEKAKLCKTMKRKDKYEYYFTIMGKWLELYEQKIYIHDYLNWLDCKNVLIYGQTAFSYHLIKDLKSSDISILGIIDKNNEVKLETGLVHYLPGKELPMADMLIITALYYEDEIRNDLDYYKGKIESLEYIIDRMSRSTWRAKIEGL